MERTLAARIGSGADMMRGKEGMRWTWNDTLGLVRYFKKDNLLVIDFKNPKKWWGP